METWIARPGDLILPKQSVPLGATRVGGLPVYPPGSPTPAPAQTACQACGKQLALLLQAHAPLSSEQVDMPQAARYLYLFGCTAEGCGKEAGCWRAFRVTAPDSAAALRCGSTLENGCPASPKQGAARLAPAAGQPNVAADDWCVGSNAADDWGVADSSDWGGTTDEASSGPSAAFDFADLNAALEAVGSAATAPAPAKQAQPTGQQFGSSSSGRAEPVYEPGRPCLPAFYLYAEPESQCIAGSSGSSNAGQQPRIEREHVQELFARYEQEEGSTLMLAIDAAATASGTAGAARGVSRSTAAAACSPDVGGGPESWGGEGYEEDAVLVPSGAKRARIVAAFFKFSKQLARCPDQCARYCFGGRPLWPSSEGPPPPQPCSACGGPRVFELQLMTPILPALAESAEWLAAEDSAAMACVLQPADSWEWLTLCIYVCRASCCGTAAATAPQMFGEEVVLVNEE